MVQRVRLTCYGSVQIFPQAPVVAQPVAGVHPLTREGGARDDKRPLRHDPPQSAAHTQGQKKI